MIRILANIGINWYAKNPEKRAKRLVSQSLAAGAKAIIVPMFQADKMYRDEQLVSGAQQYEISPDLVGDLFSLVQETGRGTPFYINPRHVGAVAFGESIDVDAYHIANGDIQYFPLLEAIAETEKPVILSTGFASFEEIDKAIEILAGGDDVSNTDLALLHSTGGTPTMAQDAMLIRILNLMSDFFPLSVGLESFYYDDFLDYVAMGYPELWGVVRRIDLKDKLGTEAEYSITPDQLTKLVTVANAMDSVVKPTTFEDTGLSETDFEARRRLLRCKEDDYLLPPTG